jgi:hypothetical protein
MSNNKSAYEIRTDILAMAKDLVGQEFQYKWNNWEMTAERDEKTGQVIPTAIAPIFPGLDEILKTADKMYDFVNHNKK